MKSALVSLLLCIAISHTSGTDSMGTDWRDNDPGIEPVVEIYQGARNSYETLGAPRVHPEDQPPARHDGAPEARQPRRRDASRIERRHAA